MKTSPVKIGKNRHPYLFMLMICFCISAFEFAAIAQKNAKQKGANDPVFKLIYPLKFYPNISIDSVRKSEIDRLFAKKLDMNDASEKGLELTNKHDENIRVFTCREWEKGISKEFYALSASAIRVQSFFIRTCPLLEALKKAQPAKQNLISDPQIGISSLSLLPISILELEFFHSEKNDIPESMKTSKVTIGQLVSKQKIVVTKKRKGGLFITYNEYSAEFNEVTRSDFDGDGYQDIWLFCSFYPQFSGNRQTISNLLLSRRNSKSIFKVKEIMPVPPYSIR